jgi:hypothetical protein
MLFVLENMLIKLPASKFEQQENKTFLLLFEAPSILKYIYTSNGLHKRLRSRRR